MSVESEEVLLGELAMKSGRCDGLWIVDGGRRRRRSAPCGCCGGGPPACSVINSGSLVCGFVKKNKQTNKSTVALLLLVGNPKNKRRPVVRSIDGQT